MHQITFVIFSVYLYHLAVAQNSQNPLLQPIPTGNPVTTAANVSATQPVTPAQPVTLAQQATTATNVSATQPVTPAQVTTTATNVSATQPVTLTQPATPAQPVTLAQSGIATQPGTSTQPTIVAMACNVGFMTLSPADIAAMQGGSSNTTAGSTAATTVTGSNASGSQASNVPTEAACKSTSSTNGGICDLQSCSMTSPAVCTSCQEATVNNDNIQIVSQSVLPQVECGAGYFFSTPGSAQTPNICTTADQRIFSCMGQCQSSIICNSCIDLGDPALASQ